MGCHFHNIIFLFLSYTCQSLLGLFPHYKAQVHHNWALVFIIRHLFIIVRHQFINIRHLSNIIRYKSITIRHQFIIIRHNFCY